MAVFVSISVIQIDSVGRIRSFCMLKFVVRIITTVLYMVMIQEVLTLNASY